MTTFRRSLALLSVFAGTLIASIMLLLCFPQALFAHSIKVGELTLYSDRPFAEQAGTKVLTIAAAKLSASPLYVGEQSHAVFVCNERWRQRLFFTYVYGVGGVNYYPLTTNVFLRDADIAGNRLIAPSGNVVAADRPLDYYIVHEITHTLTKRAVGVVNHQRLPQWVREGYADYVGKGLQFDYGEAEQAFLRDDVSMDFARSGLYRRFNLLVAYLLDKEHWSVERLLSESISQGQIEKALRANAKRN